MSLPEPMASEPATNEHDAAVAEAEADAAVETCKTEAEAAAGPNQGAALMKSFLLCAGIAAMLAGCAQLAGQVEMDAAGAATLASAAGHPERAACYEAIGGLTQPISGLLGKFETAVEARELAQGPCGPLVAGLAIHLLDKLPVTP